MKTSDFYYDLPQELIAQDPLEDRSSSRLMHLSLKDGSIEHRHFTDILDYLHKGDCLVINDTKVIPARLYGHKEETGALIEILLLKRRENDIWECLVKPGKKARPGAKITFGDGILKGEIIDIVDEGNRLIQFHYEGIFEEILDQLGEMPLPPYITHKLKDKNRYQTVYAKNEGSAAAPTAGLHFTPELLEKVKEKGVNIAHVTLHVGLGTFRPVKVDDVEKHHMHSEFYIVEEDQAKLINDTKKNGGRVISVVAVLVVLHLFGDVDVDLDLVFFGVEGDGLGLIVAVDILQGDGVAVGAALGIDQGDAGVGVAAHRVEDGGLLVVQGGRGEQILDRGAKAAAAGERQQAAERQRQQAHGARCVGHIGPPSLDKIRSVVHGTGGAGRVGRKPRSPLF